MFLKLNKFIFKVSDYGVYFRILEKEVHGLQKVVQMKTPN